MGTYKHTFTYKYKARKICVHIDIQLINFQTVATNKYTNPLCFIPAELIVQTVAQAQKVTCSEAHALQYKGTQKRKVTYPQALTQTTVHRRNLQLRGEQINMLPHEKSLL